MGEKESPEAATNKAIRRRLLSFPDTDAGNAESFELLYGNRFRYDRSRGRWIVWNGLYWTNDRTGEAERAALNTVRARYDAAATLDRKIGDARMQWAQRSESVWGEDLYSKARAVFNPSRRRPTNTTEIHSC